MKKQILFVDDDPKILSGLRRMLRSQRTEWEIYFSGNGYDALELLNKKEIDVIVSDMKMPGMDGIRLLKEVKKHFPHVARIALSGQMDEKMILESTRVVHQFLTKPCDAQLLKQTVHRSCMLRDILKDTQLRQLVTQLELIPSLPSVYLEISRELESENSSMEKISDIISRDIGMSAKILQLVNSSFFSLNRDINSIIQAVKLLGLNTIKSLVLSVQVFDQFSQEAVKRFSLNKLLNHSLSTGMLAAAITRSESQRSQMAEDAFLSGMLHDLGKLVLAHNLPERYKQVIDTARKDNIALHQAEKQILGVTHAEIGGSLMLLWGLDDRIVEAVTFHHNPSACIGEAFCPLTAIFAANIFEHAQGEKSKESTPIDLDADYMEHLKMHPNWKDWWNLSINILSTDSQL